MYSQSNIEPFMTTTHSSEFHLRRVSENWKNSRADDESIRILPPELLVRYEGHAEMVTVRLYIAAFASGLSVRFAICICSLAANVHER